MRALPIIQPELTPLESLVAHKKNCRTNPSCSRCSLSEGKQVGLNRSVCVSPMRFRGTNPARGTLLAVLEAPDATEDALGKAGAGKVARVLRRVIAQFWDGDVVFDHAIRCRAVALPNEKAPNKNNVESWVKACRPYLANGLANSPNLNRILCFGQTPYYAVTGRSLAPLSMRRGWGWLTETDTPVYMLQHPGHALPNRFLRAWLMRDLQWCLSRETPPLDKETNGKAYLVESDADALVALAAIRQSEGYSVDCEWFGKPYNKSFRLMTVGITAKGQRDSYAWTRKVLRNPQSQAVRVLQDLLRDPTVQVSGHSIKADMHGLFCGIGVESLPGFHLDTQVLTRLLETEARADLEAAAERRGWGGHKAAMQLALLAARTRVTVEAQRVLQARIDEKERAHDLQWKRKRKVNYKANTGNLGMEEEESFMDNLTNDQLKAILDRKAKHQDAYSYGYVHKDIRDPYCGADTVSTMRLSEYYETRLQQDPQVNYVYQTMMKKAIPSIYRIERTGFPVSKDLIRNNIAYFESEIERVVPRIKAYGNVEPSSNQSVQEFLYKTLKLPVLKRTEQNVPAVDEEALEMFRIETPDLPRKKWPFQHPAIGDLLEYRKYSKYLGTYSEGLLHEVRDDGRIHGSLNPDVARSGRLSMSQPSLHTIPSAEDDELSIMIRNCFVAPPDWYFIKADYDQLEYKVAAFVSDDEEMKAGFIRGEDVHTTNTTRIVAPCLYNMTPEQWEAQDKAIKKDQRKRGKIVGFADMFGMGPSSLARDMKLFKMVNGKKELDVEKARELQTLLSSQYLKYTAFKKNEILHSKRTGFSRTYWWNENGILVPFRKRMNQQIGSPERGFAAKGERVAVNSCIQGLASDMCLWAMIRLFDWIDENNARVQICVTIHDAIIFLVHKDWIEEFSEVIKEIMEDYQAGGVPITVSMEIGPSWGLMKEYKPWMAQTLKKEGFQAVLERCRREEEEKKRNESAVIAA